MFLPQLIRFLRGYLTITVSGRFCERFLNVCATKNILLWNIKKISERTIRCRISVPAFRTLRPIVRNTGVRVHINIKHGLPFFLRRYKKRRLITLSALIIVIFVISINQFVWKIEITGNYKVSDEKILSALSDAGLKPGVPRKRVDPVHLKTQTLLSVPELSWLWVDAKGSKVVVDVRENIEIPEMTNYNGYANVVTEKDAVIEKMIVRCGVPVVQEGDTVLKGTVLVTGKIPSTIRQDIRCVSADADVFARVWYEKSELFSRISTQKIETGRKKTRYSLDISGKITNLLHKGTAPFENYDVKESIRSFFGMKIIKKEYREVSLNEEILTEKTVADFGVSQLKKQLEEEVMPDSVLKSFDTSFKSINATTVEVTVKAEYLENIAVALKEEIPKDLN